MMICYTMLPWVPAKIVPGLSTRNDCSNAPRASRQRAPSAQADSHIPTAYLSMHELPRTALRR